MVYVCLIGRDDLGLYSIIRKKEGATREFFEGLGALDSVVHVITGGINTVSHMSGHYLSRHQGDYMKLRILPREEVANLTL